jgi:hypothetical protein
MILRQQNSIQIPKGADTMAAMHINENQLHELIKNGGIMHIADAVKNNSDR